MRHLLCVLLLVILPTACGSAEQASTATKATAAPAAQAPSNTAAAAPKPAPAPPVAAGGSIAGKFQILPDPQPVATPGKIEVVEVFLYTCPHCYAFEPGLAAWRKKQQADVEFVRLPASFGPNGEMLAKTYYTEEALGVTDKMHPIIFDAIHKQRRPLNTEDDMAKLFAENGIKESEFRGTFESFMIDSKVRRARQLEVAYGVTGVPSMAVNGKFGVNIGAAGGPEGMLRVVDQLIGQERKLAAKK
jgi:thiol:disulfide interchange protein DsbA